jgi:hypothetical protein
MTTNKIIGFNFQIKANLSDRLKICFKIKCTIN